MRMLLNGTLPHEPFNSALRNGTVGGTMGKILEEIKPETGYFTEQDGRRGALLVVEVEKASDYEWPGAPRAFPGRAAVWAKQGTFHEQL